MSPRYRVILWAPGLVGKIALRQIAEHPELELAGIWVHSAEKVGTEATELCGGESTGVSASGNADELLALDADCVAYMASDHDRTPSEVAADVATILAAGKNVVGIQGSLAYPAIHGLEVEATLERGCRAGASSFYPTGINGSGSQTVLAAAAALCQRVDSTYLSEGFNFETYEDPEVFEYFGFGCTPAETRSRDLRPLIEGVHGGGLHLTAAWFDETIDAVGWKQEFAFAERDIETPLASVAAGTACGVTTRLEGLVAGEPRVVQENFWWLGECPPAWPPQPGLGGYKVEIAGEPGIKLGWEMHTREGSFGGQLAKPRGPEQLAFMGCLMGTAARAVNSIPELCRAAPGIVTLGDQSPLLPRVAWRS